MSKNYANYYNAPNDSIGLEQRFFLKLESTAGVLQAPGNTDFFYTLSGGGISYSQAMEASKHRSGRHNTTFIKKKKVTSWTVPTYFNIDETQGSASLTEIDNSVQLLFQSLLGNQNNGGGSPEFDTSVAPSVTFSIFENGDRFARQCRAAFVQEGTFAFPGNGEATASWKGDAAEAYLVGIGKSLVSNNSGNTVTLQTGEGNLFPVNSLVMIVLADGVTRSADTPSGTARKVTAVSGDVITLSGASLAAADGSTNPIYLVYYEPAAPVAINNPVTGLYGSFAVSGLSVTTLRTFSLTITNGHELVNYGYASDSLTAPFFIPGSRVMVAPTMELNLNKELCRFFNRLTTFEAENFNLVLGQPGGRRMSITLPKIQYPVPAFTLPETGSIPVSFVGMAYQTALDAADEVSISFL
jgi:hypothetical protein